MIKKTSSFALAGLTLFTPFLAFAQANPVVNHTDDLNALIDKITGYLNSALVLMMSLAVVMFVWYVIQYYIKPNEERKAAGEYVMYSLIGFFVILSVWGLVNILQKTFGFQNKTAPTASDIRNLFPGGGSSSTGASSPYTFTPGRAGSQTEDQTFTGYDSSSASPRAGSQTEDNTFVNDPVPVDTSI